MPAVRRLRPVTASRFRERTPDLRDAVKTAIDGMEWLTPTDLAMRTLAQRYAEEIESSIDRAEELTALLHDAVDHAPVYKRLEKLQTLCDVTKTVALLGPLLREVLRDLGGAPAAREALRRDRPVGSRLAQLRDAAKGLDAAEDLDSAAG